MPPVNRLTVVYIFGDGSAIRQLSDFPTAEARQNFENYLLGFKPTFLGEWFQLPSGADVQAAINETWKLGGQAYNLPYRHPGEALSKRKIFSGTDRDPVVT
jgi:hypothetical protein